MYLIKFRDDTQIISDSSLLLINNGNICRIKNEQVHLISFFNFISFARTPEEILYNLEINIEQLNSYLTTFFLFIEKRRYRKRMIAFGENSIHYSLLNKLCKTDYLFITDDLNYLENISFFDIVIVTQKYSFSNIYDKVNDACKKAKKKVLNIFVKGEEVTIGPFLANDGNDFFCYECFDKRKQLNNICVIEKNLKKEVQDYHQKGYFNFSLNQRKLNRIIETIKKILDGKIISNQGVYQIYDESTSLRFIKIYSIPLCDRCNKKQDYLYNETKKYNRNETALIDLDFINQNYGIFRKIIKNETILFNKNFYYYLIQISSVFFAINNINKGEYQYNIAGGVSPSKDKALGKAIGEAAERYCLETYSLKKLFYGSVSNLETDGKKHLTKLDLFADWQYEIKDFPFRKIGNKTETYWTKALDIIRNEEIYMPASFVYTKFKNIEEDRIGYLTTSGAAASVDFPSAMLYGIYELFERDATVITWLQQLPVPRVELKYSKIINQELRDLYNILEDNGIRYQIYYVTLDLKLPCFIVIAHSEDERLPCTLIGAGCRPSKEDALIRAFEEILQGCGWSSLSSGEKDFSPGDNYCNVMSFRDRVGLYAKKNMQKEFEFLLKGKMIDFSDIKEYRDVDALMFCKSIIQEKGMHLYVKDITSTDIADLGLCVVKVYIPELQQIEANHNYRYLNCRRTIEIPQKLGYENIICDTRHFNNAPHPFP